MACLFLFHHKPDIIHVFVTVFVELGIHVPLKMKKVCMADLPGEPATLLKIRSHYSTQSLQKSLPIFCACCIKSFTVFIFLSHASLTLYMEKTNKRDYNDSNGVSPKNLNVFFLAKEM